MAARLAVHVVGPLGPYRDGFAEAMRLEGYAEGPVGLHSHLLAHLSRWLLERGLGASDLTPPVLEEFFAGAPHSSPLARDDTRRSAAAPLPAGDGRRTRGGGAATGCGGRRAGRCLRELAVL